MDKFGIKAANHCSIPKNRASCLKLFGSAWSKLFDVGRVRADLVVVDNVAKCFNFRGKK